MLTDDKRKGCSGMITLMRLWDVSFQDFMDYIDEQSAEYRKEHSLDFKDTVAVKVENEFQELAQKLYTEAGNPGNLYRQPVKLVNRYEGKAQEQLEQLVISETRQNVNLEG